MQRLHFFIKILIVICLIISIIAHTYTLLNIDKGIIDISNLLAIMMIFLLIINNRITTIFLLIFSLFVIVFEFTPFILDERILEKIYYEISFGSSFSSYLREYIKYKVFITRLFINIFGGLHFLLAIYILIIELPFRLYKAKKFPFRKIITNQNHED